MSVIKATSAEQDRFDKLRMKAASMRDSTVSTVPNLLGSNKHDQEASEPDPGDEVLPHVDEGQGQPPEITYHHGAPFL